MSSKFKSVEGMLTSVDSLFTTQAERDDMLKPKVEEIDLDLIDGFEGHPFSVKDDEDMQKLLQSIAERGVLVPCLARQNGERYELISGHRRKAACKALGISTLPVIVKDMTREEAIITMVDSNVQREHILPSEKAFAYKLKADAMKRYGKTNLGQVVPDYSGKRSTEIVAEGTGESYKQVQRFIRLTNLIPELLDMVDNRKIAFNPAVELSYLKQDEQTELLDAMDSEQATPSLSQAQRLKKFSQEGRLSIDVMRAIMSEEKKSDLDRVTLSSEKLSKYFPKSWTPAQMENQIIKLLESWHKRRQQMQER